MMTREQKREYNKRYYAERKERFRVEALARYHNGGKNRINRDVLIEYNKAYRAANPEKCKRTPDQQKKQSLNAKNRYATRPESRYKKLMNGKRWRRSHPNKVKAMNLRKKYGLTPEQVDAMISAQGDKCAICGTSNRGLPHRFPAVDHCHKTKIVRGILCRKCNQGLGLFNDNPQLLRSAASYLEIDRSG